MFNTNEKPSLTPIFVTPQDRENFNDIKRKTKPQIQSAITEMESTLYTIGHDDTTTEIIQQYRSAKNPKKEFLLQIYHDLKEHIECKLAKLQVSKPADGR